MSSEALVEGPQGVAAAWETAGQVRFALLDRKTHRPGTIVSAPGEGKGRKHPTLAANGAGQLLLAWTEGTGWQRGGSLAWQAYDRGGRPVGAPGRIEGGIPVWGLPTAVTRPDGRFVLIH